VQQGVVLPEHLAAELDRRPMNRRGIMRATVGDIAGGAHALSELDLLNYVLRPFRLPAPDLQVPRRDARGRKRWLDAVWEEAKVIVEIDGAGHADVLQYWDDMDRDNELRLQGYTTLRYAGFMIRYQADYVAGQITQALHDGGMTW
jgi:very-short-patch-repair endonuclease